ncbi:hypothetical protein AC578_1477 [Pseudocercospora eumusae]|uniref:Uncharacterized protein n=1 Tax=Pseudocercospora eumusae TaxID=321146 RepID=A0A139H5E1_9PEZI|nr:hypothetical protein AC578_1477 [Pseudocercospora eumusae]
MLETAPIGSTMATFWLVVTMASKSAPPKSSSKVTLAVVAAKASEMIPASKTVSRQARPSPDVRSNQFRWNHGSLTALVHVMESYGRESLERGILTTLDMLFSRAML